MIINGSRLVMIAALAAAALIATQASAQTTGKKSAPAGAASAQRPSDAGDVAPPVKGGLSPKAQPSLASQQKPSALGPSPHPPVGLKPTTPPPAPQGTVTLKPGEVPKIVFDTPIYEFGRVKAGGDILHDFWFTNTGTGPLEIIAVKPS